MKYAAKDFIVYRVDSPVTGEWLYVGATRCDLEKRIRAHRHQGTRLGMYLRGGGEYVAFVLERVLTKQEAAAREHHWIATLRPLFNAATSPRYHDAGGRSLK